MSDGKKQRWLKPNLETEAQKATCKRLVKEQNSGLDDVIQQLDAEIEKRKSVPPPCLSSTPRVTPVPRTEPTVVEERPDPRVIAERPMPHAVGEPVPQPARPMPENNNAPDPCLVEIAQLWPRLSEGDRDEMLPIARVKVHLTQNGK